MLHRAVRFVPLDFTGDELREIADPFVTFTVEGQPVLIPPVDDGGQLTPRLPHPTGSARIAVTDKRPKSHIEEHAVELEIITNLPNLRLHELPIFKIVRAAHPVSSANITGTPALGIPHPPRRMLLIRIVIKYEAVVQNHIHAALMT